MVKSVRLGAKFQIVIPHEIRAAQGWDEGQRLVITSTSAGVVLVPEAQLDDLVGLISDGPPFTGREKDDAS